MAELFSHSGSTTVERKVTQSFQIIKSNETIFHYSKSVNQFLIFPRKVLLSYRDKVAIKTQLQKYKISTDRYLHWYFLLYISE